MHYVQTLLLQEAVHHPFPHGGGTDFYARYASFRPTRTVRLLFIVQESVWEELPA